MQIKAEQSMLNYIVNFEAISLVSHIIIVFAGLHLWALLHRQSLVDRSPSTDT